MPDRKDYLEKLHKGATRIIHRYAHDLRHRETEAEKKLWQLIRNRLLKGRKFRRQHALDRFILDFYCYECKLAIELDGGIHDKKENQYYDAERTRVLNEQGITVIRFRNEEVINETEKVLRRIEEFL